METHDRNGVSHKQKKEKKSFFLHYYYWYIEEKMQEMMKLSNFDSTFSPCCDRLTMSFYFHRRKDQ